MKRQAGDGHRGCHCLACQSLAVIHPDSLVGIVVEAIFAAAPFNRQALVLRVDAKYKASRQIMLYSM